MSGVTVLATVYPGQLEILRALSPVYARYVKNNDEKWRRKCNLRNVFAVNDTSVHATFKYRPKALKRDLRGHFLLKEVGTIVGVLVEYCMLINVNVY